MVKKRFSRRDRNLIAMFRGLPAETSVSVFRAVHPLSTEIDVLLKKYSIKKVTPESEIQENWCYIVGELFAKRCQPVTLSTGDVLIIQASNAVVRSELQLRKQIILSRIHQLPHSKRVSDLRFVAVR